MKLLLKHIFRQVKETTDKKNGNLTAHLHLAIQAIVTYTYTIVGQTISG